jgi:hypothetical protein
MAALTAPEAMLAFLAHAGSQWTEQATYMSQIKATAAFAK